MSNTKYSIGRWVTPHEFRAGSHAVSINLLVQLDTSFFVVSFGDKLQPLYLTTGNNTYHNSTLYSINNKYLFCRQWVWDKNEFTILIMILSE